MTTPHDLKRNTIGVLAGWQVYDVFLNSFIEGIYKGIMAAAEIYDCNLLLSCGLGHQGSQVTNSIRPGWPVAAHDTVFIPVGPQNCDGLIVIPPLLSRARTDYIQDIIDQGYPVVLAGESNIDGPAITYNHAGGIFQAVNHFVAHGHTEIAFIAGHAAYDKDSQIRLEAFQAAVQEFGLSDSSDLIVYGEHSFAGGRNAMELLLQGETRFTAVLASNDESAIGAMEICHEYGLQIPQDIAVIGFDNRLEAVAHDPPLTTVHVSLFEIGYQAFEYIYEQIHNDGQINHPEPTVPVRLVRRQSCGCNREIGLLHPATTQAQTAPAPTDDVLLEIVNAMMVKAQAELTAFENHQILAMADNLLHQFSVSVKTREKFSFIVALNQIIDITDRKRNTPYAWQSALNCLQQNLPPLLVTIGQASAENFALNLLLTGFSLIGRRLRQQHIEETIYNSWLHDQLGRFTSTLSDPLNSTQLLEIIANQLSSIGLPSSMIRQIDVCFFENQAQSDVMWSLLGTAREAVADAPFLSSEFPPPGLYASNCRFVGALLPLIVNDAQHGYVAFEGEDTINIYASIVQSIATGLHGSYLYEQAQLAQNEAEAANQSKSRFLSIVSHELRNPLATVVGSTDLLVRQQKSGEIQLSDEASKDLKRIEIAANHLNNLLNDVLDLSQTTSGQLDLRLEPFNLVEAVSSAATIGQQMAIEKGLLWEQEMTDQSAMVLGDKVRLQQVILNLLGNAVKFTDEGCVSLEMAISDGIVTITVHDTGIGIEATDRELIFDEFQRTEQAVEQGIQGLGLGLAISRRLIELHGGSIKIDSTGYPGKGTTVKAYIPLFAAGQFEDTLTLPLVKEAEPPVVREEDKPLILLVDDDPSLLETHARVLRSHLPQCQVVTAVNGRNALEIMKVVLPNLVLLDLDMPVLDGFAVLQHMQTQTNLQKVPVIVLSGKLLHEEDMNKLTPHVVRVLSKGVFKTDEILAHIHETLAEDQKINNQPSLLVRKAIVFIHESYTHPINRSDIAHALGITEDYLTTCFQRILNLTPIKYLNRFRINRSMILLATTDKSITEIALSVGFTNSPYFNRVFKQEVGKTPSEFRTV